MGTNLKYEQYAAILIITGETGKLGEAGQGGEPDSGSHKLLGAR